MADQNTSRGDRRGSGRGFDPVVLVVSVLGIGVLLGLVSLLLPLGQQRSPVRRGPSAPGATDARVFEGRKQVPSQSTGRHPMAAHARRARQQQAPEADLGIQRLAGDAVVMVLASEVTREVSPDTVLSSLASVKGDGMGFEETERTPVQKGADRGILVRGLRSGAGQSLHMAVFIVVRDDILYVVTGAAPGPVSEEVSAELTAIVRDIELPPAEQLTEPPAPPFTMAEPQAPATGPRPQAAEPVRRGIAGPRQRGRARLPIPGRRRAPAPGDGEGRAARQVRSGLLRGAERAHRRGDVLAPARRLGRGRRCRLG